MFATNFYKVKLASVYDGDTFKVYLSCNYPLFCKAIPIRVKGIDTPELRTPDPCEKFIARQAKLFTKRLLESGTIILRKCERGKYFRLVCEVSVRPFSESPKHEINLKDALLSNKLAVPYIGKSKQPIDWCKL